jgi:hypothetical protein
VLDIQRATKAPEDVEALRVAKHLVDRRLRLKCLRRVELSADEFCQYHAIVYALLKNNVCTDTFKIVKQQVIGWLRNNGDTRLENGALLSSFRSEGFDNLFGDADNWSHYCDYLEQPTTWGEHVTLFAACQVYNVSINLVTSHADDRRCRLLMTPLNSADSCGRMQLCLYANWHYDATCANNGGSGDTNVVGASTHGAFINVGGDGDNAHRSVESSGNADVASAPPGVLVDFNSGDNDDDSRDVERSASTNVAPPPSGTTADSSAATKQDDDLSTGSTTNNDRVAALLFGNMDPPVAQVGNRLFPNDEIASSVDDL